MNKNDRRKSDNPKNSEWEKIGELNNFPNSDDKLMQTWLETVFTPLDLSSRHMTEILRTAKIASKRVAIEHADLNIFSHLAIYIPHGQVSNGNSWGLFHMERITLRANIQNTLDHRINFYLYVEKE